MSGNGLALLVGLLNLLLMWHVDGPKSALTFALPVCVVVALIWHAESVAGYTGWAGRRRITRASPASLVRGFCWGLLLAPIPLLLWASLS